MWYFQFRFLFFDGALQGSLKSSLKGKYGLDNFISVERTFRQEFENNCRFVQFGTEPREMQLKQTNSTSPSTEMKIDIVS